MALSKVFKVIAQRMQEASTASLSFSNIQQQLQDELRDRNSGEYCYITDIFGDETSGDLIYTCGYQGEMYRCSYELGTANGNRTTKLGDPVDVLPRMVYDDEADEGDEYSAMEAAKLYTSGAAPLCERFISKSTRDKADSGSFAGKGKSYPILKREDVMAAVRSIGRAGADNFGAATIKANIIRIAKAKGFGDALPKAWQDGSDSKESKVPPTDANGVRLVEAAGMDRLAFTETNSLNPLVKIISAGRGSSGYYTKQVLERDGPKIFKRGTLMYINHATPTEEAERPEGDYSKLAAVTTGDAYWDEKGKDGPALYAPSKVFAGVASEVREKAPFTGVSIRASGYYAEAASGNPSPLVKFGESKLAPDGKPGLIGALTRADSIDLVTKAGRDGKLLLESENSGEDMDETKLVEAVKAAVAAELAPLKAENKRLSESIILMGAPRVIHGLLSGIRLPDAAKNRILERYASEAALAVLPIKEGKLDAEALGKMIEADAKREAQYLMEMGFGDHIAGIGTTAQLTEAQLKEHAAAFEKEDKQVLEGLADLFVGGTSQAPNKELREASRLAFINGRAA